MILKKTRGIRRGKEERCERDYILCYLKMKELIRENDEEKLEPIIGRRWNGHIRKNGHL